MVQINLRNVNLGLAFQPYKLYYTFKMLSKRSHFLNMQYNALTLPVLSIS